MSELKLYLQHSFALSESGFEVWAGTLPLLGGVIVLVYFASKRFRRAIGAEDLDWRGHACLGDYLRSAPFLAITSVSQGAELFQQMVCHLLESWPQPSLRLYLVCNGIDAEALGAFIAVAQRDSRLRVSIIDKDGVRAHRKPLIHLRIVRELEQRHAQRLSFVRLLRYREDVIELRPSLRIRRNLESIMHDHKKPILEIAVITSALLLTFIMGIRAWIIIIN